MGKQPVKHPQYVWIGRGIPSVHIIRLNAIFNLQPVFQPFGHRAAAAHSGTAMDYPDRCVHVFPDKLSYPPGHVIVKQDIPIAFGQILPFSRSRNIIKINIQNIPVLFSEPVRRRTVCKNVVCKVILKRIPYRNDSKIRPQFYIAVIKIVAPHRMLKIRC